MGNVQVFDSRAPVVSAQVGVLKMREGPYGDLVRGSAGGVC